MHMLGLCVLTSRLIRGIRKVMVDGAPAELFPHTISLLHTEADRCFIHMMGPAVDWTAAVQEERRSKRGAQVYDVHAIRQGLRKPAHLDSLIWR